MLLKFCKSVWWLIFKKPRAYDPNDSFEMHFDNIEYSG